MTGLCNPQRNTYDPEHIAYTKIKLACGTKVMLADVAPQSIDNIERYLKPPLEL